MQLISIFPQGKATHFACATTIAVTLGMGLVSSAKADMPEYWERETYHTERPTTASFFAGQSRHNRGEDSDSDSEDQPVRRKLASANRLGGPSDDDDEANNDQPRRRKRAETRSVETEQDAPQPKRKHVRVASLGNSYVPSPSKPSKSLSGGGGIKWLASAGCLDGGIRSILSQVASRFGSVTVNSTCRSRQHNRSVGGASRSKHLTGDAADFRVHGNISAVAAFLRSQGGGYKHYGGGLFHIDNGPTRTW
ncbi:MAG: D-Ala-D-Ala carboxypeptidase family metallohydrolase [Hyphomicrobiaceae bacterium]